MARTWLIIAVCFLAVTSMFGQNKEMFIEQIAGKTVTRENFDKEGKLKNTQIFLIGELQRKNDVYKVQVTTKLYDENNEMKKKYTTSYWCEPNEFDVLINVFPFANPNKVETKVVITSKDFRQLYDLSGGDKLKDIHLKLSVESGVLNFLGSKNLVTIRDRQQEKMESGEVRVYSNARIEAYLLGLKIKTISYSVEEYLIGNSTLEQQIFKEKNGSYFTMNYSKTI
ncbi:MAG TPA: hypothetical protein PKJ63_02020 [Cyclobacteriaceae bacterium]|nr:hypothetical protein [Cyclobacteriaceae bacterium]